MITKHLLGCRKAMVGIFLFGMSIGCSYAQNWMDVTDLMVKNPSFTTGTPAACNWNDGTTTPSSVDLVYKNAEMYQKAGKIAQKIYPVPAGKYKLSVQGFFRAAANNTTEIAKYAAGTEVISSFLFANGDSTKIKSLYSEATGKSTVGAYANGYPNNRQATQAYFLLGDSVYRSTLETTVAVNQGLFIGVNSRTASGSSWTCWSNFKLYVDTTGLKGSLVKLSMTLLKAQNIKDTLNAWGVDVSPMVDAVNLYNGYTASNTDAEDLAAIGVLNGFNTTGSTLITNVPVLKNDIKKAEALVASVNAGTYFATAKSLQKMDSLINVAKTVLAYTSMSQMATDITSTITKVEAGIVAVNQSISFCFPLLKAKTLADQVGGLVATNEYKAVDADLKNDTVSFDVTVQHVKALNVVSKNAMSATFLNTASDQTPLDFTSFIINPNIYQSGEIISIPVGWNCNRGKSDYKNLTTSAYSDSYLYNGSHSGNANNNIGYSHYYQILGGSADVAVLPDGLYQLKAATYSSASGNIQLYASSDSVNFSKVNVNGDLNVFNTAESTVGTTTQLINIEVKGGKLYIGIKGTNIDLGGYVGGGDKFWNADNFRLLYVGSSVVSVYQDRLKERVVTSKGLQTKLIGYTIDDQDDLGWYLGQDSSLVTSNDIVVLKTAIADLDEMIAYATTIVANYEALAPLVTTGEALNTQLEAGFIVSQPNLRTLFETALVAAEDRGMSTLTWDNVLNKFAPLATDLSLAINNMKQSIALCYPLAKAKLLAQKIGGLGSNAAYTKVVADLANNTLDPMDADMDVLELNAVCAAAMTDAVKQQASEVNPFEMTSFIVNPNIYQNSTDSLTGVAVNTKITGWNCTSNGDYLNRTLATSGDTYLYNSSWSANVSHNISTQTNYNQVVGGNGEGKIALPNGVYMLSAATYSDAFSSMRLYAMAANATYNTATFNGIINTWNIAQSKIDTTTSVRLINVENGMLTIGVKGVDSVTFQGGTGHYWYADNFRLYYVGKDFVNAIDRTSVEPAFIDVYDVMGRCLRRGVKASEATLGLQKGFYIVGKKKVMINF